MDWVMVIKDCGLQALIAGVLVVQFFVTVSLRRRVRALEHYERWYADQQRQYQSPTQPMMARAPLPKPW
jgi:hypothetical protein